MEKASKMKIQVVARWNAGADYSGYNFALYRGAGQLGSNPNELWEVVTPLTTESQPTYTRLTFDFDFDFFECKQLKVVLEKQDVLPYKMHFSLGSLLHQPKYVYLPILSSYRYTVAATFLSVELLTSIIEFEPEIPGDTDLAVVIHAMGKDLEKKDLFGLSDPLFRLFDVSDDSNPPVLLYESEHILKTLTPDWERFTLPVLANHKLWIEVYDWNPHADLSLIGSCACTFAELTSKREMKLLHPKKDKDAGVFVIEDAKYVKLKEVTAYQYLKGGAEINLMLAVDFTASNGDPVKPNSLHYHTENDVRNPYARSMLSLATVLMEYDADQLIPTFGFGGKFEGSTSMCFPLNGKKKEPECLGHNGVFDAYRHALNNYELDGPNKLGNVLYTLMEYTKMQMAGVDTSSLVASGNAYSYSAPTMTQTVPQSPRSPKYKPNVSEGVQSYVRRWTHAYIVGNVSDSDAVCRLLVEASDLPLSIVILGVGDHNFNLLKKFADPKLTAGKRCVSRPFVSVRVDILFVTNHEQFVDVAKLMVTREEKLTSAALKELPGQMCAWFIKNGIVPNYAKWIK